MTLPSPGERSPHRADALVEAVEHDRAALAARLHDGPVQILTAASLRLQSAVLFDELTAEVADEVASGIAQAAGELRRLMSALTTWEPGRAGFPEALRRHIEASCAPVGVQAHVLTAPISLAPSSAALALRLTQDGVADALDADATWVEVQLEADALQLTLEIRHDGRADRGSRCRPGLVLLTRRAEAVGGRVELARTLAGVSSLLVSVPATGAAGELA